MSLPILPGLGASDATEPVTPKLDWRKALLPALGSIALGGQGGGAFLKAFLQGQMAKLEREEREVEKRAAAQEKRAALQREFVFRSYQALSEIDDPELVDETKTQLKSYAAALGLDPSFLDTYLIPESKRKRLKRQRAGDIWDTLVKRDDFAELWERNASVDLPGGESVTLKELARLIDYPIPRATVKEPVTATVAVPRTGEGGLARFLAPAGTQEVQVGERERTVEMAPFATRRPLTLGQYDPATFAKFPHLARLPVPVDSKTGLPDPIKMLDFYKAAGHENPTDIAKRAQERVDKDRADYDRRLGAIQQQMNQAKTEEVFRGAVMAYNRLVEDFRRHKPWVGAKQMPLDVPSAVAQWRQVNQKKPARPPQGGDRVLDRQLVLAEAELRAAEDEKKLLLANPPGKFDRSRAQWENRLRSVNSRILKARAKVEQLRQGRTGSPPSPPTTPAPDQSLDEFYR